MGEGQVITVYSDTKIEQLVKEMMNNPADQVILRVAPDCKLLNNEVNLRLVKFYAEEVDKELIINASDEALIAAAQRVGLSTIREREVTEADFRPEESPAPKSKRPSAGGGSKSQPVRVYRYHGGLIPALLVAFFTFIVAVWWFLQPKATVIVYPKEQFLNFRTEVLSGLEYQDRDLAEGRIPAKLFEKNFTLTVQSKATGFKVIGVTQATGKVTVINSTAQPLTIPKGTVFVGKDGIQFTSDKAVVVPKKVTKYQYGLPVGEEYGRVEVPITAVAKGSGGNLPPKAINRIEGSLQRHLTVINLTPTAGGTDQKVAVVTLDDVKRGEAEAREQMMISGTEEAGRLVDKNYLYLPELTELELIRVTSSPEIGETAETVTTKLEYRVSTLAPSQEGIRKYLKLQLDKNMPANFEAKNNDVSLVSANAVTASGKIQLELVGRGTIRGILNQAKIKELVKGKTITEAKAALATLNEVADCKFDLRDGRSKLPSFGFQIRTLFPAGSREPVRP
ncbi:MAG TPA: baseplate J/gp47 family protein [Bacillota bacterium]|nr:baseplate J/gp47 family protein [Bacillota bacterium]HPT87123.1 baseplate J/gp47 family protein [Bacillota bacterium]